MRLKHALRNKIIFISVFFMVLGLLINTTIHSLIASGNYSAGLVEQSKTLGISLRFRIDRLLLSGIPLKDLPGMNEQCNVIADSFRNISYVMVTDRDGAVIFANDPEQTGRRSPLALAGYLSGGSRGVPDFFEFEGIEHTVTPLEGEDGRVAGFIILGYPQRLVTDTIIGLIRNSLLVTLVTGAVMIVFLVVVLRLRVTRPLSEMLSAIERMRGLGNQAVEKHHISGHDEFSQMAAAFYDLLDELKNSQETLEKHAGELEEKVRERTIELNTVNNNLMLHLDALERSREEERKLQGQLARAQKLEAMGNLASGVAHDLNNILSGLVNYPELLLMEMPPDSPYIKPVTSIKRAGERAAAMVQDLLTLARRGAALTVPMNLNAAVREFVKITEFEAFGARHPTITLTLRLEENLPNFIGSHFHIMKILMDLVTNSAEAINGPGVIVISTESCFIEQELKGFEYIPPGNYVMLRIADSGVGIPREHLEKVFEPFFSRKVLGRRGGTGLGMAVVYSTVKDHKGYIDVQSDLNSGTVVSLFFRQTRELAVADDRETPLEESRGNGERILVIDDIQEQREIVESILLRLGYTPVSAASGEEGVAWLKENTAELVILDMIMDPGIDGLETFRRMREIRPHQKAIITSGFTDTSRVLAVQELGAGEFVKKPYSIGRLGRVIRSELDR